VFGYDMHKNIIANAPDKEPDLNHPHYSKYLLFQDISTIPFDDLNNIFDKNLIINALK
jgi:hypothetical protein